VQIGAPVEVDTRGLLGPRAGALRKATGGTAWNAAAASWYAIKANDTTNIKGVSMVALQDDKEAMFGLRHGANAGTSYTDIDFAMCFTSTGQIQVYEGGKSKGTYGTYGTNSLGRVVLGTSGRVQYVVDGEIRYTSTSLPEFPLVVDASFKQEGAAFSNISWSGPMAPDAEVACGELVQFTSFNGVGSSSVGQLRKFDNVGASSNSGAESKYKFTRQDKTNITGVSAQITEITAGIMFGLNHDSASQNYQDIDFAINFAANGLVRIYESGSNKGNFGKYEQGSVGAVRINIGGRVEYAVDGATLYTSTKPPTFPLAFDVSFLAKGSELVDMKWVGCDIVKYPVAVGRLVEFTSFERVTGEVGELRRVEGSGTGWNAGATSVYGIGESDENGVKGVQMTIMQTNTRAILGLNHGDTFSTSYTDIDYAMEFYKGKLQVYEKGALRGPMGPMTLTLQARSCLAPPGRFSMSLMEKSGTPAPKFHNSP